MIFSEISSPSGIWAGIVTHNRLNLLKRCVDAIRKQSLKPERLLVVDNDSSDGTREWLECQPDVTFLTQPNEGGAGGFKKVLELAAKNEASMVWVMDDDGLPAPNALQNLVRHVHLMPAILNSVVVNEVNHDELVWKVDGHLKLSDLTQPIIPGIAHLFNGSLIDIRVVKSVGLPKSELVLWGDESEYFERVRQKFPVYTVSSSAHYHPKTGFDVKKNLQLNFKLFYFFRNRYYYYLARCENKKAVARIRYSIFIISIFLLILTVNNEKRKKLKLLARAVNSALTGEAVSIPKAAAIIKSL